ncbi:unnamed protein product (macronuclear) [Paramecium tetraurelia]|uniref:Uncharacterized protein n=1 Tax=Paramecium tetraurelia TaxID=5888 RepID=A0EH25_PARTE|nr:uncharacterized protein GSPATT00026940001 [Paramecium tetraurelia]CAK94616.1 unnamed protein product [Paramecium tetraurelia]|eukprot:XP_001461989.1 hypothetical protein (macronuclear) [Paramecium tetraurelia strain d4-2]
MLTASPHMKSDKPYQQSPQYKKPHPYNPEASISLKNSINLKDFQFNEELEYYKTRSADLEQYARQLKNELDTTIIRMSKQGALDEKAELMIHQNQILSSDIDKLQKNFAQKKTECELWKSKYEQQLNSAVQLKAQYELDLRKLSNELKMLEERNAILEKERSHEVEATKTNFSIQNEQQRHSYLTQIDVLENQLRKLREYAEIRDKEIYELENKLTKVLQDREYVETKLLKDNDIYRTRLQEQERDNQIEMNNLRQKLDILNQGQLDNIKNQYMAQAEILDDEIEKLKGLLGIKNEEIKTLIDQNERLRANYEREIETITLQFHVLKEKMFENEQRFQEESQQMENNLRSQHEIGVETLQSHHQNSNQILENQIAHLKGQVLEQSKQLEELQKIRQQLHQANLQDQENAQNIINNLKKEIQDQQSRYQDQILKNYQDYDLQKKELLNYNQQQLEFNQQLQQQIQNLNQIIELKEQQYETTLVQFKNMNDQLINKLNDLYRDNEQNKAKFNVTVAEQEDQLNKQLKLIKQQEHKIQQLSSTSQRDKQNAERQITNLQNQNRQKEQQLAELKAQLKAAEENLDKIDNELQETKNTLQSQIEEQKYNYEQEIESIQSQQNEDLLSTKKLYEEKETSLNQELIQLKGNLQTQQTLNIELNQKLDEYGQQIQNAVNNSDVIKQYEILSEINLINRLRN